jgi:hypothetical protein
LGFVVVVDSLIDVSVLPAVNKGDTNGALGYPGDTGLTRTDSAISLGELVGKNKPSSSKVVDAYGMPLVVYHGTATGFTVTEFRIGDGAVGV